MSVFQAVIRGRSHRAGEGGGGAGGGGMGWEGGRRPDPGLLVLDASRLEAEVNGQFWRTLNLFQA